MRANNRTHATIDHAETAETARQQAARRAVLVLLAGAAGYDLYAWVSAFQSGAWQLFVVAGVVLALAGLALFSTWTIRRGSTTGGVLATVAGFWLTLIAIGTLISGLGVALAVIAPVLTAGLVLNTLPRRAAAPVLALGVLTGGLLWLLDYASPMSGRMVEPTLQVVTQAVAILVALAYGLLLLRLLSDFSLRAKLLIAFLVVALAPVAVLAVLNTGATRAALTASANQNLLGVAAQTALSIDTFINNTKGIIQTESQNPVMRAYLELPADARRGSPEERALRALLPVLQLRDTRARTYMLLDASGTVVASTFTLDVGDDYSQADFFTQAVAIGQSYVSDITFAERAEEGDLYFSVLIRGEAQRPLGVLVARYNARVVQDIIDTTAGLAGAESFGAVYDENLMQIAHGVAFESNFQLVGPPTPAQLDSLMAARRLPTLEGAVHTSNQPELAAHLAEVDVQPFFAARDLATGDRVNQVAVTYLATRPWIVAFFQPQDVFLAPVDEQTQATLALAAVLAVVVSAAALVAAQLLADPIARLTRVANQVAAGDLSGQAHVESRDEIGTLATTFNTMTARLAELVGTLESRVAERTAQLQAAADISRATASVRDLDELLRLALDLIRERFGYYHASIFLIDATGRYAALRESTGEVGAQLKARGHRLAVGSRSLIGWVTANRQARVAHDVADDPFHFKNPLLPETRSELAIPLVVGDRLLGALNVQSTEADAFGEGDVQVLQTLADQLSIAIENAQLFAQTEANLRELSTLYQRMTGASWRSLLHGRTLEKVYQAPPGSAAARHGTEAAVQVPLVLRGQSFGVIEIHGRPPEAWTPEERTAIDGIAAQLAAALESAALLEDAQRRRAREQIINDITHQMRSTLNPANVLQSGIRELGRALGATEVVVRLASSGETSAADAGVKTGPLPPRTGPLLPPTGPLPGSSPLPGTRPLRGGNGEAER